MGYASGHPKSVTVRTHHTRLSAGRAPRGTPVRGRNGDKMRYAPGVCSRRQDPITRDLSTVLRCPHAARVQDKGRPARLGPALRRKQRNVYEWRQYEGMPTGVHWRWAGNLGNMCPAASCPWSTPGRPRATSAR
jgi:hypothetical protein